MVIAKVMFRSQYYYVYEYESGTCAVVDRSVNKDYSLHFINKHEAFKYFKMVIEDLKRLKEDIQAKEFICIATEEEALSDLNSPYIKYL